MEMIPVKSWKLDFARSAEPERFREMIRRAQEETRKKDKEEKAEASAEDALDLLIMASASDLAEFGVTLNHYETATYEALLENERLLDIARREQQEMLEKAYTLPDGRKVFESEDGLRVFDADGNELDASVVTPEEIEDWRPKHEVYQDRGDAIDALVAERADIIEYQDRLALAREQAESGEISQAELKALERELATEMPEAVRSQLPKDRQPEQELDEEAKPKPAAAFQPGGNIVIPAI